MLTRRLSREVQTRRGGNAQLAAGNEQTRKQLAAGGSPAAMEEAARKAGFARPGEQVYVIVKPTESSGATAAVGGSAAPAAPGAAGEPAVGKHRRRIRTVANAGGRACPSEGLP